MEHFIDKYIPLRIQKMIEESLRSILPDSLIPKIDSFQMNCIRKLNDHVLSDESNSDLKS
jgi:hypothetical protein